VPELTFSSGGALLGGNIEKFGLTELPRTNDPSKFSSLIDEQIKLARPVIIQIDYKKDSKGDHFIQVRGKDASGRYTAADPAGGVVISFTISSAGEMQDIKGAKTNYTAKKTPHVVSLRRYQPSKTVKP
jgi:hypothetical protein